MNKSQLYNNITFRKVSFEDLNLIYILLENMKESIDPILFATPSINYLEYIIASSGYILGAFFNKKPIAFASYICPKQAKTNLTQYINAENSKIIQFENCLVDIKYQGNGILLQLLNRLNQYYLSMRYDYIISTVHPRNMASLITSFKIGQEAVRFGNYYNYRMRFLMFGSLHPDLIFSSGTPHTVVTPMNKYNKIYQLLKKKYKIYGADTKTNLFYLRRDLYETTK